MKKLSKIQQRDKELESMKNSVRVLEVKNIRQSTNRRFDEKASLKAWEGRDNIKIYNG